MSPSEPIDEGDEFLVVVVYGGVPEPVDSESLGQVGWTTSSRTATVFVLSQPEGASTWFPANDHPIDKARFNVAVTVPEGLEVASNGVLLEQEATAGRRPRWVFEAAHPMAPYLATVVIGELIFEEAATGPDGISVRNVVRRGSGRRRHGRLRPDTAR